MRIVLNDTGNKVSVNTHQSPTVGDVSKSIQKTMTETGLHYLVPYSRLNKNPLNRFLTLKSEWLEATHYISSLSEIVMHPSYQKIIGMGETALPMIINELKQSPQHWFWALSAITMQDPVKPEDRGNLEKMRDSWLQWAKNERITE